MQRRRFLQTTGTGAVFGLAGCTGSGDPENVDTATEMWNRKQNRQSGQIGDGELVLATTTSTYDTGLLDELNPVFEQNYGITVQTIARGTGASIRLARDGDADVVLVHARGAEDQFMQDGFGVNRRDVMFNDFVVVGPENDPAGISGMESATEAFDAIADRQATFVSRGDDSGTHKKERNVWAAAGTDPSGQWYREVGRGMGDTLVQASQTGAYTLADRGTYLSMQDEINLVVHVQGPLQGGPVILRNPYGVMAVNPARYSDVNYQAAMAYVGFLTSPQGQSTIDDYTANGSQLFFPNALAEDPDFQQYVPEGYGDGEGQSTATTTAEKRYLHWVETRVPDDY